MPPKRNRFYLGRPPSPLPFIPPIGEAFELLGAPGQLDALVRHVVKKNNKQLPVSAKTLRAAVYEPVTLKTADKIRSVLYPFLPFEFTEAEADAMYSPWRNLRIRNNGHSWQAGILFPLEKLAPAQYMTIHSVNFLKERIEQELQLLTEMEELLAKKAGAEHFQEAIYRTYREGSLVDDQILKEGTGPLIDWSAGVVLDTSASSALRRLFLHMAVDFHFSLIANFDYDLCEAMAAEVPAENVPSTLFETGLFGDLVPEHPVDGFKEPLEILLKEWRTTFAIDPLSPLSWADLYRKLPFPHNVTPEDRRDHASVEDARLVIDESRRSQFNAWRNGQTRPSKEHMDAFVECLVPEGCDTRWASLRIYWASALGKLIKREREDQLFPAAAVPDHEVTQAFCNYQRYRAHFATR